MKKILIIAVVLLFNTICFSETDNGWPIDNGWPTDPNWWNVAEPEDISSFIDEGADVNARLRWGTMDNDTLGISVLGMAASYAQNTDVIKLLIKTGARVNKKTKSRGWLSDPWGHTVALAAAARSINSDNLKILIDNGADFNTGSDLYTYDGKVFSETTAELHQSNTGVMRAILDLGLLTKPELKREIGEERFKYIATYTPKKPEKDDVYTYPGYMSCLETDKDINRNEFEVKNKCNFPIALYVCSVSNSRDAVLSNSSLTTGETIQCGQNNRYFQTVQLLWNDEYGGVPMRGGRFEWFACHINDSILYNKTSNDRFACKSNHKQLHANRI